MFPNECLVDVLKFLDRDSVDKLESVCRRFRDVVRLHFGMNPVMTTRIVRFELHLFPSGRYNCCFTYRRESTETDETMHGSIYMFRAFLQRDLMQIPKVEIRTREYFDYESDIPEDDLPFFHSAEAWTLRGLRRVWTRARTTKLWFIRDGQSDEEFLFRLMDAGLSAFLCVDAQVNTTTLVHVQAERFGQLAHHLPANSVITNYLRNYRNTTLFVSAAPNGDERQEMSTILTTNRLPFRELWIRANDDDQANEQLNLMLARLIRNEWRKLICSVRITLSNDNVLVPLHDPRLLGHGFVNALPRVDDNADGGGDGKQADASTTDGGDGDCRGMGDAKDGESAAPDAKDVADELEETGQLDGVKEDETGNKPDDSQQPPPAGDNPIEMEDDFAAGLEDLDGEDVDEDDAGGQKDDGQEAADDRLDWEKGDVEAPEERQLDPELWDRPADAPEPEAVDEDDASGANQVSRDDKKDGEEDADGDKTGDSDESRKAARQKSRDGREKDRECEAEEAETAGENAAAERRPDRNDRAELAARDDELLERANDRAQPPRQWGSDKEDIADEFDENGEEACSAERDECQHLQARHIVQRASAEEAAQTRDLLRRLENQRRTADGERPLDSEDADAEMDAAEDGEDDVEVLPDAGRPDDDIIVISEHIRQMAPLADGDAAPLSLLEDRDTIDEMDAGRALAMELRWSNITGSVAQLASMLAENLRIILEPTVASRLQGDYRTGKRLNVRRLIAYVASDYRKDRIWMRRTKKVKRNYQIVIAVDDSASMRDNRMSAITCHSLCLIEKALRQLEVGQLMICKFGADVKVLSDFGVADASADSALGARLMNELTFAQQRTDLANLLAVAGAKFGEAAGSGGALADRMLIILGDGRGVMTEGVERVRQALKRLDQDEITVLFIIVDTPKPAETADGNGSSRSIFDVRVVTGYARNEAGQQRTKAK